MLLLLIIFLAEMVLLFVLSHRLTTMIYYILFSFFRNEHIAWGILTFLNLPGTVVHEFAHLIVAEVLRVPTGELSFTPQIEKNAEGRKEVKAGYLKIAQTDIFRRFLIGFAPVLFGLIALLMLIWLFRSFWPQLTILWHQALFVSLIGYLLFAVSNNMFSSRADMEGAPFFLLALFIVGGSLYATLYFTGIRISLTGKALEITQLTLISLTKGLGVVLVVNFVVYLLNIFFIRGIRSLRH